ncbi:MAG TPA: PHB depolymerase family esterase [Syntrophales bacterium]|nr:PHB depolymerase family esterase [Syntrophales bacterium]HPI57516.1 PHB depolymerase family esterase [Syntrophales bacterium]HPN24673.1 PHB depolymerase family esterase [Syntrophales bacterium]HQM29804.1 PHB depolymerase family esterase [Syntrophales bacterium]
MNRRYRISGLFILALVLFLLAYLLWGRGKGVLEEVTEFGSNPGKVRMYKYVPARLPPGAPLVVALHGCDQDAKKYSLVTGWNALAERYRFAVLYPETGVSNNALNCWNWFRPGDQARGVGEALSVKQMVDAMIAAHRLDPGRVFVTGLSAGGAMTNVLLAVYPDVFAGGAPMAGVAYGCASNAMAAVGCMNGSRTLSEEQQVDAVRGGCEGYSGPYPVVSIWQGTKDTVVSPLNAGAIASQWRQVHDAGSHAATDEVVQGSRHIVYENRGGKGVVEVWRLEGMGHGISVDPDGSGGEPGGASGAYAFDRDIWSSYRAAVFWRLINPGEASGRK